MSMRDDAWIEYLNNKNMFQKASQRIVDALKY